MTQRVILWLCVYLLSLSVTKAQEQKSAEAPGGYIIQSVLYLQVVRDKEPVGTPALRHPAYNPGMKWLVIQKKGRGSFSVEEIKKLRVSDKAGFPRKPDYYGSSSEKDIEIHPANLRRIQFHSPGTQENSKILALVYRIPKSLNLILFSPPGATKPSSIDVPFNLIRPKPKPPATPKPDLTKRIRMEWVPSPEPLGPLLGITAEDRMVYANVEEDKLIIFHAEGKRVDVLKKVQIQNTLHALIDEKAVFLDPLAGEGKVWDLKSGQKISHFSIPLSPEPVGLYPHPDHEERILVLYREQGYKGEAKYPPLEGYSMDLMTGNLGEKLITLPENIPSPNQLEEGGRNFSRIWFNTLSWQLHDQYVRNVGRGPTGYHGLEIGREIEDSVVLYSGKSHPSESVRAIINNSRTRYRTQPKPVIGQDFIAFLSRNGKLVIADPEDTRVVMAIPIDQEVERRNFDSWELVRKRNHIHLNLDTGVLYLWGKKDRSEGIYMASVEPEIWISGEAPFFIARNEIPLGIPGETWKYKPEIIYKAGYSVPTLEVVHPEALKVNESGTLSMNIPDDHIGEIKARVVLKSDGKRVESCITIQPGRRVAAEKVERRLQLPDFEAPHLLVDLGAEVSRMIPVPGQQSILCKLKDVSKWKWVDLSTATDKGELKVPPRMAILDIRGNILIGFEPDTNFIQAYTFPELELIAEVPNPLPDPIKKLQIHHSGALRVIVYSKQPEQSTIGKRYKHTWAFLDLSNGESFADSLKLNSNTYVGIQQWIPTERGTSLILDMQTPRLMKFEPFGWREIVAEQNTRTGEPGTMLGSSWYRRGEYIFDVDLNHLDLEFPRKRGRSLVSPIHLIPDTSLIGGVSRDQSKFLVINASDREIIWSSSDIPFLKKASSVVAPVWFHNTANRIAYALPKFKGLLITPLHLASHIEEAAPILQIPKEIAYIPGKALVEKIPILSANDIKTCSIENHPKGATFSESGTLRWLPSVKDGEEYELQIRIADSRGRTYEGSTRLVPVIPIIGKGLESGALQNLFRISSIPDLVASEIGNPYMVLNHGKTLDVYTGFPPRRVHSHTLDLPHPPAALSVRGVYLYVAEKETLREYKLPFLTEERSWVLDVDLITDVKAVRGTKMIFCAGVRNQIRVLYLDPNTGVSIHLKDVRGSKLYFTPDMKHLATLSFDLSHLDKMREAFQHVHIRNIRLDRLGFYTLYENSYKENVRYSAPSTAHRFSISRDGQWGLLKNIRRNNQHPMLYSSQKEQRINSTYDISGDMVDAVFHPFLPLAISWEDGIFRIHGQPGNNIPLRKFSPPKQLGKIREVYWTGHAGKLLVVGENRSSDIIMTIVDLPLNEQERAMLSQLPKPNGIKMRSHSPVTVDSTPGPLDRPIYVSTEGFKGLSASVKTFPMPQKKDTNIDKIKKMSGSIPFIKSGNKKIGYAIVLSPDGLCLTLESALPEPYSKLVISQWMIDGELEFPLEVVVVDKKRNLALIRPKGDMKWSAMPVNVSFDFKKSQPLLLVQPGTSPVRAIMKDEEGPTVVVNNAEIAVGAPLISRFGNVVGLIEEKKADTGDWQLLPMWRVRESLNALWKMHSESQESMR